MVIIDDRFYSSPIFFAVMPKDKKNAKAKKGAELRHSPLSTDVTRVNGKLRPPKSSRLDDEEDVDQEEEISEKAMRMIKKVSREDGAQVDMNLRDIDEIEAGDEDMEDDEEEEEEEEEYVEMDGEYVSSSNLTEGEEAVVNQFLQASGGETRSLADIIMSKIKEKEEESNYVESSEEEGLPPKVVEIYTSVGSMLRRYTAGKLPKALKMLPNLKNWEEIMWLTRPDEWSPCGTFACTRIFASNLNEKMAQRFFNIVLLEKVRDDIRQHGKLNYHLYMALKKALYKPASFYKGFLLPLAHSQTCTLREALIVGSVLAKVSIPGNHSAAALLHLAQMPYSGSSSMFIKVLLNKKYALPRRVVSSVVDHFAAFEKETKELPVLWHQSLLVFAQRYKLEINDEQRAKLKNLLRVQQHHQITPEIRRELFSSIGNTGYTNNTAMSM